MLTCYYPQFGTPENKPHHNQIDYQRHLSFGSYPLPFRSSDVMVFSPSCLIYITEKQLIKVWLGKFPLR